MVEIIKENCDWRLVKNICRMTEGKEYTDKEPSDAFIEKILISEHSPIRVADIFYRFVDIPYWESIHFARHIGSDPFISTQRPDRTGIERDDIPQGNPVREEIKSNCQSLIDMARKRLCYQASTKTRIQMEELKEKLAETQPKLAKVLVPNCVYRCACPEFKTCGYFKNFIQWAGANGYDILDVSARYDAYEDYRKKPRKAGE